MVFMSESSIFYTFFASVTANITGSWFITLLAFTMVIIFLAFAFRIPLEFTAILLFPLLLGFAAFENTMMAALAVGIIFLSIIIAKNFFFWT